MDLSTSVDLAAKRTALAKGFFLFVTLFVGPAAVATPVHLRCDYQDQPLGIDSTRPRLAWQSDSTERNWTQTAYRLLVSSRPELAVVGKADVWDSGKQDSAASVDIPYAGPPLVSRRRYFWSVQVWDNKGRSTISAVPAWWEMGLLQSADWKAQWITGKDLRREEAEKLHWVWVGGENAFNVNPGTIATFRYTLDLKAKPLRAILSAAAHGDFVVSVNGHLTGNKKSWAAFDVEDIEESLRLGANEILIAVTAPKPARGDSQGPTDSRSKTAFAAVAALITLTDPDGTIQRIAAGEQWQARADKQPEWKPAQVVADLKDPRTGQDPGLPPQSPALLRHLFRLQKQVAAARLYVTAAGSYRMSINRHRVGDADLAPGFTDYRKRLSYQTYDVSTLLKQGDNVIGAILGDGWYASPLTWNGSRVFSAPVRLRAQLEIEYKDGSHDSIGTGPTWKTAASPILSSEIYAGEMYDARLEQPGWDAPGFKDAAWENAPSAPAPEAVISSQVGPPVHVSTIVQPKAIHHLSNGDLVFDMGQNMVGWTRLRVSGPPGSKVKLRFAERLNPDGTIYTENLRNADATDVYTLRGGGAEVYTPHFTFHGFQYVQVSGLPGRPTLSTLTGEVVSSLGDNPTGRLDTSSALLNRMWHLGVWAQRGNFLSIPTDCPQRDERLGWMGDAGVYWRTGSYNFDIAAFTHKFMQDIVDAQLSDGSFPDIAPNLLRERTGAPGWGDAGIIVPYTAWLQYGDRSLIEQNWQAMERWMDLIQTTNPNFLREKGLGANYGDWLAPDPATPKTLVATAYWAIIARMMATMAQATGHDDRKYAALFDRISDAYQKAYVAPGGSIHGETQTGYLLTLYAGLAPDTLRPSITDKLVANIHEHGDHLTTGFLGTPFLLFVLADNKQSDVAYQLLLQDTYPSWGYMIAKGATTWWERWNGDSGDPSMNSYNHYSFGSVVAWIYQDVVGIDTDTKDPGFKHLIIRPHFNSKLTYAHGEYDSVYGKVVSSWRRTASGPIELTVTVPANSYASVYLEGRVKNGHPDGVIPTQPFPPGDGGVLQIGSGTYQFLLDEK